MEYSRDSMPLPFMGPEEPMLLLHVDVSLDRRRVCCRFEIVRLHSRTELLQPLGAVFRRGVGRQELGRAAAELAHLFPQRYRRTRIVAGARCDLEADCVGFGF